MPSIEYRGYNSHRNEHSYRVTVSAGYDKDINQVRARKTFRLSGNKTEKTREREIAKLAAEFEYKYKQQKINYAPRLTISEFSDRFIEMYVKEHLKKRTIFEYKRLLKIICTYIGHYKLIDFSAYQLQHLYVDMKSDDLTLDTIDHCHAILSSMFSYAIKMQLITVNPCKIIDRPRLAKTRKESQQKKIRALTVPQIRELCNHLEQEPVRYRLATVLALFAGLRKSEINGLRWSDINFEDGSITISRQVSYTSSDGIFEDTPKTNSSSRTIYPPKAIFLLAKEYRNEWEKQQVIVDDDKKTDYVFIKENGGVIHPDTITGWFRKFIKKIHNQQLAHINSQAISEELQIPHIRFHDLRHTCGTLRSALGENIFDIGSFLGHSSKSSTEIYMHPLNMKQQDISSKIDDIASADNKQS